MKIGILGLLPEQVRMVQQEFPQHSLHFLNRDREGETRTFAKGCDKVILMTKFISHTIQDRIPERKRLFCNGSVSGLKSEILKLPTPCKVIAMPQPIPMSQRKPAPAAAPVISKKPGKQTLPPDEIVDWSPLDNAKPGETVRIKRPAKVTIALFDGRVTAGRCYRKKHFGVHTTPHKIVDGYAVMTVKDRTLEAVAALETGALQPSRPDTPQEEAAVQVFTDTQRNLTTAPALQARESAFWQSAFIETMRQWPGAPVETIAARADECLRAYTSRAAMAATGDRH